MKALLIFLLFILLLPLYSQDDSLEFTDYSCSCIKSLPYKTMPDSFKLGLKYPNPSAYNFYEYFSVPESSIVKFLVNDISLNQVKETEFCLIVPGNYQISFAELLKPIEDFKSGVYFFEMNAFSPITYKQVFKGSRKVVFVK